MKFVNKRRKERSLLRILGVVLYKYFTIVLETAWSLTATPRVELGTGEESQRKNRAMAWKTILWKTGQGARGRKCLRLVILNGH